MSDAATHYLEEAEMLADRVGIINEGRLLLVEDKRQLMRRLGEKRLHIRFDGPVGGLPAELQGGQLAEDRRSLVLTERNGGPATGVVLQALFRAGITVLDVETRASRLEDVLLEVLHGRGGEG